MKLLLPEFFSNRDPFLPEIQEFLKHSMPLILPKTINPDGPRILIIHARLGDPKKVDLTALLKVALMIADILMNEDDNYTVAGQEVLVDLQDLPYKYITQLTPIMIKKLLMCFQNGYPLRQTKLHFINTPFIFEAVYTVVKQVVKEKLLNKFKFSMEKGFDNISKMIPPSILSERYDGREGSIDEIVDKISAEWKLKVESYRDWFLEDAKYCSDETKRSGQPKTSADMFGVEGSFRKLEVD